MRTALGLILVICVLSVNSEFLKNDGSLQDEFHKFMTLHGKRYESELEYEIRLQTFKINVVKMVNSLKISSDEFDYSGYSEFMDLTEEEFKTQKLGFKFNNLEEIKLNSLPLKYRVHLNDPIPESFDWNEKGLVTPVKNQGSCGSCWAFSATGNLEGLYKQKTGNLVSLSEQELVDCDKKDQGCNGGFMEDAFDQLKLIGGIESDKDYPYKGRGQACAFDASKVVTKIAGHSFIDTDEEKIKEALFKVGPLAVALNATPLQFYFGGIFHPWKVFCNPDALNHAVLLTGWGEQNGKKYWIVKNSWGKLWGEKGYFRLFRGEGVCGINTHVITAHLE